MAVKISKPDAADYIPTTGIKYVDTHKLIPFLSKLSFKLNLILCGETGIGKSLAVAHHAWDQQIPLITHWCSEDQRREQLIGHLTLQDKETVYNLGPLPKVIDVANQHGKAILLLEEINGLTAQSQKLLNPLTDWHREIETDYGFYRLNKGVQIWIVGTMNLSAYGGVFALNTDLKSRFRLLPLGYASSEEEKNMVTQMVPGVDQQILQKVLTLAQMTRQEAVDYALSPRDVVDIVSDAQIVGLGEAVRLQSGKFEGDDRDAFVSWVKQVFTTAMLTAAPKAPKKVA